MLRPLARQGIRTCCALARPATALVRPSISRSAPCVLVPTWASSGSFTTTRCYSAAPTATSSPPRARRALLYVPGSNLSMLKKAIGGASDVDALILDLEDSVATHQKGAARSNVFDALQTSAKCKSERFVRINAGALGLEDLEVILKNPYLDGIVMPKVDTAAQVLRVVEAIESHALKETKDKLKIIASIESPLAVLNLREIATCSKRVDSLLFAAEDYCASSNLIRTESRMEMLFARSSVVTVAKAFGLNAIDLVRTSYKGPAAIDGLRAEAQEGRQLGFDGKQAIHPAQVSVIQEAFTPSEKEIERAFKILADYQAASGGGAGAYGLVDEDGSSSMIDAPMLLQAEKVLSLAKAAGVPIAKQ